MPPDLLAAIAVAGLFGCFIGSFLNVCIHRLPRNESVVHPPSRCYGCGTRVAWYDNLPVIAYVLLRGRCRWCGSGFSPRYLALEVVTGALTAATAWWVFSGGVPWEQPWQQVLALMALLVLAWVLLVSTVIDLDHLIIPDELTKSFQVVAPFLAALALTNHRIEAEPLPVGWMVHLDVFGNLTVTESTLITNLGVIVGATLALLLASIPLARWIYSTYTRNAPWSDEDHRGFRLGVFWFCGATAFQFAVLAGVTALGQRTLLPYELGLAQAILGSLAGWSLLYGIGFLGTIGFRRNAMGFGDVKFLAPVGAFLGPVGVVYAFFAASIAGAVVGVPLRLMGRREIPFGPWLTVGAIVVLMGGGAFHRWLLGGFVLPP